MIDLTQVFSSDHDFAQLVLTKLNSVAYYRFSKILQFESITMVTFSSVVAIISH